MVLMGNILADTVLSKSCGAATLKPVQFQTLNWDEVQASEGQTALTPVGRRGGGPNRNVGFHLKIGGNQAVNCFLRHSQTSAIGERFGVFCGRY